MSKRGYRSAFGEEADGTQAGEVTSGGSSTDNAVPRWNGTSGESLQNSGVILSDTNTMSGVGTITQTDGSYITYEGETDTYFRGSNGNLTICSSPAGVTTGSISLLIDGKAYMVLQGTPNRIALNSDIIAPLAGVTTLGSATYPFPSSNIDVMYTDPGTAGAPSLTETTDTASGIYFPANNTVAISTNSAQIAQFANTGTATTTLTSNVVSGTTNTYDVGATANVWKDNYSTRFLAGAGTGALPSYGFNSGSNDIGMYLPSANKICFTTSGIDRFSIQDTTARSNNIQPSADSTYNCGANGNRWLTTYTDNVVATTDVQLDATGTLTFRDSDNSHETTFTAGNQSANINYTLPTADGTSGHFLTTNGSGVLSWANTDTYNTPTQVLDSGGTTWVGSGPSVDAFLRRTGNATDGYTVTAHLVGGTDTYSSGATNLVFATFIPSGYRPYSQLQFPCYLNENGGTFPGRMQIATSGTITVYPETAFSSSTCGLADITVSWVT